MRRLAKTDENLSDARVQGWSVILAVLPYLWPEGDKGVNDVVATDFWDSTKESMAAQFKPGNFQPG